MSRLEIPVVLVGAWLVAACGGAAPQGLPGMTSPESAPQAPEQPEDETTTDAEVTEEGLSLSEAEAALARDERLLLAALGPTRERALEKDDESAAGGAQPSVGQRPSKPAPEQRPAPGGAEATKTAEPPCRVACRALASMQRSQERVCELTAEDDARCTRAKQRVEQAEQRLTQAGCQCEAE